MALPFALRGFAGLDSLHCFLSILLLALTGHHIRSRDRVPASNAVLHSTAAPRRLGETSTASSGWPDCPCIASSRLEWTSQQRRDAISALLLPSNRSKHSEYMCPHRKPECAQPKFMHQKNAWTRDKSRAVHVNDRIISVDDIVYGYEKLNEADEMYSKTTFQGVAMQQDPIDALAIADLLWRVRPRLLIELGTAGGGSALFYAKAMLAYDPLAKVLTMDPSRQASPLVDWNAKGMRQHCPHCTSASHSAIWERSVTFLRMFPTSKSARGLAAACSGVMSSNGKDAWARFHKNL